MFVVLQTAVDSAIGMNDSAVIVIGLWNLVTNSFLKCVVGSASVLCMIGASRRCSTRKYGPLCVLWRHRV